MTFLAPWSLIATLPWLAATAYLLRGRGRRHDVPFLALWGGLNARPLRRRHDAPPRAIILALAAALFAILAGARPISFGRGSGNAGVDILVDRGLLMSARSSHGRRFQTAAERLAQAVGRRFDGAEVRLWPVPATSPEDTIETTAEGWLKSVAALEPTAADTRAALQAVAAARLRESSAQVFVLTDQFWPAVDDRLRFIPSTAGPVNDVAIRMLAVRSTPSPQAMVRLDVRGAPPTNVSLRVKSAGQTVERSVSLTEDANRNIFIDLAAFDGVVRAEIDADDDIKANNFAWAVRSRSAPRVEAGTPLPTALERMKAVYGRRRLPSAESRQVAILNQTAVADSAGRPTVYIARSADENTSIRDDLKVVDHPLTRAIDWRVVAPLLPAAAKPPEGFQPLVGRQDGTAWLATCEDDPPQVWTTLAAGNRWTRRAEYVVCWASIFDWLGGGVENFASNQVGPSDGEWKPAELAAGRTASPSPAEWPGLYRRDDGLLQAFNAAPVAADPVGANEAVKAEPAPGVSAPVSVEWTPVVCLAALACAAASAAWWPTRRPGPKTMARASRSVA